MSEEGRSSNEEFEQFFSLKNDKKLAKPVISLLAGNRGNRIKDQVILLRNLQVRKRKFRLLSKGCSPDRRALMNGAIAHNSPKLRLASWRAA